MVLSIHILTGAAIATKISNPVLGLFLAFFSHFALDLMPHQDYFENKHKRTIKTALDLTLGILMIFIFSKAVFPLMFIYAFFSVLPDGLSVLNLIFQNKIRVLKISHELQEKIHFWKRKKIPFFWKVFNQALIISAAIYFLRF